MKKTIVIFGAVLLCLSGTTLAYLYLEKEEKIQTEYKTPEEADIHVRFGMEAYDKIMDGFWNKVSEEDFSELFRLALEKTTAKPQTLISKNRLGTAQLMAKAMTSTEVDKRKQLVLETITVVTFNLAPAGRSGIFSEKQEVSFRENVANIDKSKNLYADLGLETGATKEVVEKAFDTKTKELGTPESPEEQAELEKITYAKEVLTTDDSKNLYDQAQIEPTVFTKKISDQIYYVNISKISPTTLSELIRHLDSTNEMPEVNSLVIDLRGNIGGSIDFLQYFFGLFIGQNQLAFDFYHQGEYQPFRTVVDKLPSTAKFKRKVVLTDEMTQSTAELLAAGFKRYNLGLVIGKTTRGWGTVENTFPFETVIDQLEKYSLLLVHSLTLRDDNQPIEGNGVDPNINTEDSTWPKAFNEYYNAPALQSAVAKIVSEPPLK